MIKRRKRVKKGRVKKSRRITLIKKKRGGLRRGR